MAQKKTNKKINNKKTITNKKVKQKSVSNKTAFKTTKKVKKVAKPIKKKEIVKTKNKKSITPAKKAMSTEKKNSEKIIASQKKNDSKTEPIKKKEIAPVVATTTTNVDKKEDAKKEIVLVKPYKRPSRLNYFWIVPLLLLFIVSIALPAGFYFAVIHDPRTKEVTADGNININNSMNYLFTNSITNINNADDEKNYGFMTIDINENSLDNIAMTARNKLVDKNAVLANFVPKMYFEIVNCGDHYDYNLYADVNINNMLKTRIGIMTTLDEKAGESTDPYFQFKINNINLGRFGVPDFLTNIIKKFVNTNDLNKLFSDIGVHLEFNLEEKTLIYRRSQFAADVTKFSESLGKDNIFSMLITEFITNHLIFEPEQSIVFKIDLRDMQRNKKITPKRETIVPINQLNDARSKIITLLDSSNPAISTTQANEIFNFILHGHYDEENPDYSPEEKAARIALNKALLPDDIKDLDLTSIGIPLDKTKYVVSGDILHDNPIFALQDKMKSTFPSTQDIINFINNPTGTELPLIHVFDNNLYDFSKSLSLIGHTTFFITTKENNQHIANYVTINNADFSLTNVDGSDQLQMFIDLCINGYKVEAILTATPSVKLDDKLISFQIKDIYFGNVSMSNIKQSLINFIAKFFSIGGDIVKFDSESQSITINFNSVYNSLPDVAKTAINEAISKKLIELNIGMKNSEMIFSIIKK